jgi:hypothetical protein
MAHVRQKLALRTACRERALFGINKVPVKPKTNAQNYQKQQYGYRRKADDQNLL